MNASSLLSDFRDLLLRRHRQLLLVVIVLVGAGCGLVAVLFHLALALSDRLLAGAVTRLPMGPLKVVLILAVPATIGALLSVLVPRFAPQSGGGLGLVRRAYAGRAALDLPTFAGTFAANTLSLGAGTPLGPEGPTVVLTSTFATRAVGWLGLPRRLARGMIPVGTAAGIAAIFAAPITGVVFALEEIIGTASRGVLGSALIAAVAAAVVERGVLGGDRLLPAAPAGWSDPRELFGFALLGIIAGLVAGMIPRAVPFLERQFARLEHPFPRSSRPVRGLLAGLCAGLCGLVSPPSLGVGYASISGWLHGDGSAEQAALAFVMKLIGVVIALSAPLVGGVFAPSLFLGASLGAAVGHAGLFLFPKSHIDPGAYALVGMGALFAGFLRTPISSVLIVFEVTGDYGLVLPLMLAVALSSVVARRLSPETLVESHLRASGVKIRGSSQDALAAVRVGDVMSTGVLTLESSMSFREAESRTEGVHFKSYPVVDEAGRCVGLLQAEAIQLAVHEGALDESVGSKVQPARILLPQEMRLGDALSELARAGETRAPVVVSETDATLTGFLSPTDVLKARLEQENEDDAGPLGTLV